MAGRAIIIYRGLRWSLATATYQFLVDLRQLVQGLDDPRDDLLLNDLLAAVHLHTQIGYRSHYVSKDLPFPLFHQHFEEYFQEPLLIQMRNDLGVLGEVADEFYHESKQVRQLFVSVEIDARLKAILECGYLGLLHEVLVQACLRSHVAQGDTCALYDVNLAPLSTIQEMDQWLDLAAVHLTHLCGVPGGPTDVLLLKRCFQAAHRGLFPIISRCTSDTRGASRGTTQSVTHEPLFT